jgi:tetratricopeptide (TPR) repeat protein
MKKAVCRLKTQDPRIGSMGLWVYGSIKLLKHGLIDLLTYGPIDLFCILYLVSSSYGGSSEEIDHYSPENILKFAEHLYQERDYLRAAGEYQRYLFYSRQNASSPLWERGARGDLKPQDASSTLYKIGLSYRQAGDTERAISFFRKIATEHPESQFRFAASLDEAGNSDERGKLQVLAGFNYLHQRRWRDAEYILKSVAFKDENLNHISSGLRTSAREGISLPRKNPILAGLFSAVLPGMGKIYCKQYGDGLYSLILTGVTALLAWDGFRENGVRSVKGWLFGSVGVVFYAGNVYGSAVAARIYSRRLEADLLKHLPAVPHL